MGTAPKARAVPRTLPKRNAQKLCDLAQLGLAALAAVGEHTRIVPARARSDHPPSMLVPFRTPRLGLTAAAIAAIKDNQTQGSTGERGL